MGGSIIEASWQHQLFAIPRGWTRRFDKGRAENFNEEVIAVPVIISPRDTFEGVLTPIPFALG